MTKELILKYFNNRCTEAELNEVVQWIELDSGNADERNLIFDIWKNYHAEDDLLNDDKFSLLFDKIQQKIDADAIIRIEHRKTSILVFTSWLTKVAAVVLIPVLAFLFYTLSERKSEFRTIASMAIDSLEVIAPIGSRTVVHLSDGSEVHLNYGSTLKYPQLFYGETRGVELTGEGYFAVAHNPDKPFIVKTGNLNIKAVGTEFNVQSYPGDEAISTTLVEGKVLLEKELPGDIIEQLGAMKPGQHVIYNSKTGVLLSDVGNVNKYIAWKDGKMVFDNEPIEQVAQRLGRMFNVDIQVENAVKEFKYTVTFVDEPLFQILELLTVATPINYRALPRIKNPDSTFSKQKILIERKQ